MIIMQPAEPLCSASLIALPHTKSVRFANNDDGGQVEQEAKPTNA